MTSLLHTSYRLALTHTSILWLLGVVFMGLVYLLGYQVPREKTVMVFSVFGILFAIFLWSYGLALSAPQDERVRGYELGCALLCRGLLLFSIPALSDDYFRFIWDGEMVRHGIHPYLYVPSSFSDVERLRFGFDDAAFKGLNSPDFYTVYPPLSQAMFWCSAMLSDWLYPSHVIGGNLVFRLFVMKVILLSAEVGIVILLTKLLRRLHLPLSYRMIYSLNPLMILEFTGNCHTEPLMICFMLLALLAIHTRSYLMSGVWLAVSVSAKLLTVLFLPLVLLAIPRERIWKTGMIFLVSLLVLFAPLMTKAFFLHMSKSITLFVTRFEFNSGIYTALKLLFLTTELYAAYDYLGRALAVITVMLLAWRYSQAYRESGGSLEEGFFWVMCIYFFLTPVVHPWYLASVVALSVFVPYRFGLLWSGGAVLSYSAYAQFPYAEKYELILLYHTVVFGVMAWEIRKKRPLPIASSHVATGSSVVRS